MVESSTGVRIAVVHPWLPKYRVEFFDLLRRRGAEVGLHFEIFYGEAPPEWRARSDTSSATWATPLPTRFFTVRGRTLILKSLRPVKRSGPYDLIIVEQAVRNLETFRLMAQPTPIAFWGHGATYTKQVGRVQEAVKQWLTARGSWFLAYTPGGGAAVTLAGFPGAQVTILNNANDTAALTGHLAATTQADIDRFNTKYDLRGKTALFIGGLDEPKRIPFLLDSAALAYALDPDFRLLIAGNGCERGAVEEACRTNPAVHYLGAVFGTEKALALRAAQVIAMPGRVGLVAVDSFAAGTPIVTTSWPWHAPEFEYLQPTKNALVTADDQAAYAGELVRILNDAPQLMRLAAACRDDRERYSIQLMVENFVAGVLAFSRAGAR